MRQRWRITAPDQARRLARVQFQLRSARHQNRSGDQPAASCARALPGKAAGQPLRGAGHVAAGNLHQHHPVMEERHNQLRTDIRRFTHDVDAYYAAADRIMRDAAVPVIDLHAFSARLIAAGLADHVHFNEPAQQLQTAIIAGALRILLNNPTSNP